MVKKRYKVISLIVVLFIVIQFYRPIKNVQKGPTKNDFLYSERAPKSVAKLFKNSCYDCHSNFTKNQWYSDIAPASWFISKHVEAGKYSINFSNWAIMDRRDRRAMLSATAFDMTVEKMPLKSYLMLNSNARLTEEEKDEIMNWISTIEINMFNRK